MWGSTSPQRTVPAVVVSSTASRPTEGTFPLKRICGGLRGRIIRTSQTRVPTGVTFIQTLVAVHCSETQFMMEAAGRQSNGLKENEPKVTLRATMPLLHLWKPGWEDPDIRRPLLTSYPGNLSRDRSPATFHRRLPSVRSFPCPSDVRVLLEHSRCREGWSVLCCRFL